MHLCEKVSEIKFYSFSTELSTSFYFKVSLRRRRRIKNQIKLIILLLPVFQEIKTLKQITSAVKIMGMQNFVHLYIYL